MKIYNVIWQDRHVDPSAKPFSAFGLAKRWARKQAVDMVNAKGTPRRYLKEIDVDDWLYCIEYSVEGDMLWITEHEMDLK